MKVTIGGDRLGSGNKQTTNLRNYERSTHNLSTKRLTSMAPGVLYPVYTNVALNGDTFDINIDADTITLPTQGPLFGSFKLQVDVFQVPIRLYQGILHNNPLNIGLKMSQVIFPKLHLKQYVKMPQSQGPTFIADLNTMKFSPSCLLKYLGISGIGSATNVAAQEQSAQMVKRYFNAVPALAYYDIFKNYYANKQEAKAFVIKPDNGSFDSNRLNKITIYHTSDLINPVEEYTITNTNTTIYGDSNNYLGNYIWVAKGTNDTTLNPKAINILVYDKNGNDKIATLQQLIDTSNAKLVPNETESIGLAFQLFNYNYKTNFWEDYVVDDGITIRPNVLYNPATYGIHLEKFDLKTIDDMRYKLLGLNQLGQWLHWQYNPLEANEPYMKLPYSTLTYFDENFPLGNNVYSMNGLVVKTYQSDIFNNWVQTDWIDGDNGINAITAVDTSSGSFTMDALLLAQKTYDMLNRIAVSGGTYEDWQEAVYTQKAIRKAETPIYCGGMSSEVVFEQVVQTSASENNQPLGNLGGKGKLLNKRYGKLHIKINEPSFLMVIASLTPRVCYSQGNEWYMTELETIDDLHKPALDGIGFQELITEQMAYFDTSVDVQTDAVTKYSAGKVPAWLNYMTDVDKVFGDFAELESTAYMVLNRQYGKNIVDLTEARISDLTTYIDPSKYNYAFAVSDLYSQNFWTEIALDIKARRKMSAKIIPNL